MKLGSYLPVSACYSAFRTLWRTHDRDISTHNQETRKMMVSERIFSAMGSAVIGMYFAPLYLASDICAMERFYFQGELVKEKKYYNIIDVVIDLNY